MGRGGLLGRAFGPSELGCEGKNWAAGLGHGEREKEGTGWAGCWVLGWILFSFSNSISSLFFFSLFKLNSNYIYSNSNSKFEFNNLMHTSK